MNISPGSKCLRRTAQLAAASFGVFMAAVSCAEKSPTIDKSSPGTGAVIINLVPEALSGEVIVRFDRETSMAAAEAACADGSLRRTKAGEENDLRYLNDEISEVLEECGAVRLERLFRPDPRFEDRTKAEGLDRWYVLKYDDSVGTAEMAGMLGECKGVEVVECLVPFSEDEVETLPGPVGYREADITKASVQASSPFNEDPLMQKRQWDLNNDGDVFGIRTSVGADCNVYRAWTLCKGNPDVIVAVFDQGIKYDHEDLAANMWVNLDEIPDNGVDDDGNGYIDDIYGWNFVEDTPYITSNSEKNHATHIAGTIAAVNNNGKGVCGIAGGSGKGDGVKLMSLQILGTSETGSGGAGTAGKIRAMKYAADNGAVISSNSWGSTSGSISLETWKYGINSAYTESIKYFIKYAGMDSKGNQTGPMAGGIVVCSAGNDATADLLHYPSCDPYVLAVAATRMDGQPAYYTNYASWVTLSAPGGDTKMNSSYGGIFSTDILEGDVDGYGYMQGTSMACPHVSGALALAVSYFYGEDRQKGLTPDMLREALLASTNDINAKCPEAYIGKMGIGSLDTYRLLQAVKLEAISIPDATLSVGAGTTIDLSGYFISGNAFSVSVSDESIVKASISRSILTLEGLSKGEAEVSVSDARMARKEFTVTVR